MKTFEEWFENYTKILPEVRHLRGDKRVKELAEAAWIAGQMNAPLPLSIQEALNSGDGG